MSEFDEFIASLSTLGVDEVRSRLSRGSWANRRKSWAQDWLSAQGSARVDTREEETLAIAKEANRIASEQATAAARSARWAMYAAIIAAIAAAIATKDQILALIFGPP